MVPYTATGQFLGTRKGYLLSRSSQGFGLETLEEPRALAFHARDDATQPLEATSRGLGLKGLRGLGLKGLRG